MMPEHQTTGGYPCIAEVIYADLSKLVQQKPGNKIQFILVKLEEADRLNIEALKLEKRTINAIQTMIES
jgi:allophanate hydrolase subunit 2